LTISIVDDGSTGRIAGVRTSSIAQPRVTRITGGTPNADPSGMDPTKVAHLDRLRMIA
jgi:hypothetical protein